MYKRSQNNDRIARDDNKVGICRHFMWAVLYTAIARKSDVTDRTREYRPPEISRYPTVSFTTLGTYGRK